MIKNTIGYGTYYRREDSSENVGTPTIAEVSQSIGSLTVPDTISRRRPDGFELFAQATSRDVSVFRISDATFSYHDGIYTLSVPWWAGRFWNESFSYTPVDQDRMSRLEQDAFWKAFDRLKDVKLNSTELAIDHRSTVKMLAKYVELFAEGLYKIRRKYAFEIARYKRRKPERLPPGKRLLAERRLSKNLADHWLEYQYALKPTGQELLNLLDIQAKGLEAPQPILKGSAKYGYSLDSTHQTGGFYIDGRIWGGSRTQFNSRAYQGKITILAKLNSFGERSDVTALRQLGVLGPVSTFWAATRLSFVVDWLVDVTSTLQAIEFYQQVGELGYISGHKATYTQDFGSGMKREWAYKSRSGFNHLNVFSLLQRTRIGGSYTSSKLMTTAALLTQAKLAAVRFRNDTSY